MIQNREKELTIGLSLFNHSSVSLALLLIERGKNDAKLP